MKFTSKFTCKLGSFFLLIFLFSIFLSDAKATKKCNLNLRLGDAHVLHPDLADEAHFTPDNKKVLSILRVDGTIQHEALAVSDLKEKNGIYKTIDPYDGKVYPGAEVRISDNSKYAYFIPPKEFKAVAYIYEAETNRLVAIPEMTKIKDAIFSENSNFIIAKLENNQMGVYNIGSKAYLEFEIVGRNWAATTLTASDRVLVTTKDEVPVILDLNTGEQIKLPVLRGFKTVQTQTFKDVEYALFTYSSTDGKNEIHLHLNLKNLNINRISIEKNKNILLLPDGQSLLTISDQSATVLNVETEKPLFVTGKYASGYSASKDGQYLVTREQDGSLLIIDLLDTTRKAFSPRAGSKVFEFSFLDNAQTNLNELQIQYSSNDRLYFGLLDVSTGTFKKWQTPHNSIPIFSSDRNKVLFQFPDLYYSKGGKYTVYDLSEVSKIALTSKAQPSTYFKKLEKPGTFNVNTELNSVLYYFESGLFRKNKRLTQKILFNVLSRSSGLYESIIGRYPELGTEGYFAFKSFSEVSPAWQRAIKRYLNYFTTARVNSGTILESLPLLNPLKNYFKHISYDDVYEFSEKITEGLIEKAFENDFKGVFPSMLYKFSSQYANILFSTDRRNLPYISFIRKPYELTPIIFSTKPIDDNPNTLTPYGFYAKRLPTIHISKDAKQGDIILKNQEYDWTSGHESYTSVVDINVMGESLNSVTPKLDKINLRKFFKDGKLTGLVVFGSNLTGEFEEPLKNYIGYFKKNGFKFDEKKIKDDDFKSTLKEKITSGEVDYFIKEAHSDGDEQNVFRINKENKVLRATKKLDNGKEEVVYIVYPAKEYDNYTSPKTSVLVSNDEFAEWINKRENQFVMFDTGCWSISKAKEQIEKTFSSKFYDISSSTPVYMFENVPTNAEVILLNNFRNGESLARIEENLKNNPANKNNYGNNFAFYHSEKFKKWILDNAKPALDIDRIVMDSNGKIINIDD